MMQACEGYLIDGRFTPFEKVTLPSRVNAVLVFEDINKHTDKEERLSWLKKFHSAVKQSANEEMLDFPRMHFGREVVDLSDEV